ncbi:SDR family NAD(P)-dependent oxidoreductase [Chitinophagaceae bacterium LB-8]|uniref:SDR family NAD(P)-dependent oxidoreductase n=1 Tax=Paraflavisolibacter caeni TaxID=2982496 RepID=A0A9X2XXP5_9BACT|nr:SDR family NAD(P)-dependent oxidoreductase [Paraflavisolibacter caeni]MCU7549558.1 SDR family NAD(P)-dependent oxidoreductase [Paraflavisolibacter caeni]
MARIFITGSADGLGQLAAKALIKQGHQVVLHARNAERAKRAFDKVPGAGDVLTADLSSIDETKALASKVNALGKFDAVIHNAGVYQVSRNSVHADGLPVLFVVNSLAPYILTCLIQKPERLIYLSSGMHLQGDPNLDRLPVGTQGRNSHVTYSDTKLHDVILSMAIARKWTDVFANAVDPGWVPTKMGGAGAPDNIEKGFQTQVWLAVSNEPEARVSGYYFHHKRQAHYLPAAKDAGAQEQFLARCEQITGVLLQ